MLVPRAYGSASDVYTWEINYSNNAQPQVCWGCEVHAHTEARQTCINRKLITQIIINPK